MIDNFFMAINKLKYSGVMVLIVTLILGWIIFIYKPNKSNLCYIDSSKGFVGVVRYKSNETLILKRKDGGQIQYNSLLKGIKEGLSYHLYINDTVQKLENEFTFLVSRPPDFHCVLTFQVDCDSVILQEKRFLCED